MKNLIIYILIIALNFSFKADSNTCHLTGVLENCPDSVELYLANTENPTSLARIEVNNGTFQYDIELTKPKIFMLMKKSIQYKFRDQKIIWLEPSDIKISGNYEFLSKLKDRRFNIASRF